MFCLEFRAAWAAVLVIAAAFETPAQESATKPYRDSTAKILEYNGPGRDKAEPLSMRDVRIAYFGPGDLAHPDGGTLWAGATMAIEEANAAGGYHGVPFRLVPAWTDDPWRGGVAKLARLTYDDTVWAIIGGIDGATTHLAEQLLPKALLPLVNPVAGDRTIHGAGLPWVFSCAPGDHLQAATISRELKRRGLDFALISAVDHDSRAFVKQLELAMSRDRLSPSFHLEWQGGAAGIPEIAGRVKQFRAAVVIAGAKASGNLVRELRKNGFDGLILCGPWIARLSPDSALRGVMYTALADVSEAFRRQFKIRYNREADYAAALAYDAATVTVAAIRKAGLNRARIRDEIRALSPIQAVSGTIDWDSTGQNRRAISLAVLP